MSLGHVSTPVDVPAPTSSRDRSPWADLRLLAGVWAVTRLLVLLGAALAGPVKVPGQSGGFLHRMAVSWDGQWYLLIAQHGYSSTLRAPTPLLHRWSEWAFFPAFPLLLRAVHEVTRLPYDVTGLVVAYLAGLAGTLAVYRLGTTYAGRDAGRIAALLFVTWPGSVALSLTYSEGLAIASAALALDALLRRRWAAAGAFGLVATASRVTGIAVVVAALVVAVLEIRRRRDWSALLAPVVGAAGMAGFLAYGWARTGDPLVWRHAEGLWSQRLDLLVGMGSYWVHALPKLSPGALLQLLGAVGVIWLVAVALGRRLRLSDPVVVSCVVSLALDLGSSGVGPRPRMVLAAFPLMVLAAPQLSRRTAYAAGAVWAVLLVRVAVVWVNHSVTP